MRLLDLTDGATSWGATEAERGADHPGRRFEAEPATTYVRAVGVEADAATTFRWVCQLKVAPYSYDWIDNLGRRSPRRLSPGADELAVGQRLMIGRIVDFSPGEYLVVVSSAVSDRVFGGPIVLTYEVMPTGPESSRLVARVAVTAGSRLARLRRLLLGWGDLVMMRKQLVTLKALAERQARAAA